MYPYWPSDDKDIDFGGNSGNETPFSRPDSADNRITQAVEKIKGVLLEIYVGSKKKNTNVADWKDKAENVFAETQHIYGQKGKKGKKETELLTELCWLMWELNEHVGEFALKDDQKIQTAIRKNADELASKIRTLYNPTYRLRRRIVTYR